jgi:hypothetical protein
MGYDDERLAWFEPSSDPYKEWVCHDISEPKGPGSQRYSHGLGVGDVMFVPGDGHRTEIITKEGVYWRTNDDTISVTHSACLATINGRTNLITGKRKWAHPPGVDVGSEEPSWLVRYELVGEKWTRYIIDEDSGVGTQFVVQDVNGDGLVDIVTANKNGVFLFVQRATGS